MPSLPIKIVCLAGGTGGYTIARSLSRNDVLNITMIVPSSDDGGSSRRLMDEDQVPLPPGDAAQAIMALARGNEELLDLMRVRLQGESPLAKHSVANLLIAAESQKFGGDFAAFKTALDTVARICGVHGRVLPVSQRVQLGIERSDGSITIGEDEIDEQREAHLPPIVRIFHQPEADIDPDAAQAILDADAIFMGPGSFATSFGSIAATKGLKECLVKSSAKKIAVSNVANEAGHTSGWCAHDYGFNFQKLIAPVHLDMLIANTGRPPGEVVEQYQSEGEELVPIGHKEQSMTYRTIEADILATSAFFQSENDAVKRSLLRHDTYMLQAVILLALRQLGVY